MPASRRSVRRLRRARLRRTQHAAAARSRSRSQVSTSALERASFKHQAVSTDLTTVSLKLYPIGGRISTYRYFCISVSVRAYGFIARPAALRSEKKCRALPGGSVKIGIIRACRAVVVFSFASGHTLLLARDGPRATARRTHRQSGSHPTHTAERALSKAHPRQNQTDCPCPRATSHTLDARAQSHRT
jgi:hypothetical protein